MCRFENKFQSAYSLWGPYYDARADGTEQTTARWGCRLMGTIEEEQWMFNGRECVCVCVRCQLRECVCVCGYDLEVVENDEQRNKKKEVKTQNRRLASAVHVLAIRAWLAGVLLWQCVCASWWLGLLLLLSLLLVVLLLYFIISIITLLYNIQH